MITTRAPSRIPLVVAAPLLAVGSVAYSSWVLETVLPTRLSTVHGFASELFAADQPYRWFFGGADVVAGLCAAVAGGLALRRVRGPAPAVRWAYLGWAALVLFGVATVLDVVFPLDCAPSLAACDALELAGRLSFSHDLHLVTSVVANVAVLVAIAALSLAARVRGVRPTVARDPGAVLFWAALAMTLATAVLSLHDMGYDMPGFLADGQGVPQRVQVGLTALWLAVAAASLRPVAGAGGDDGRTGTAASVPGDHAVRPRSSRASTTPRGARKTATPATRTTSAASAPSAASGRSGNGRWQADPTALPVSSSRSTGSCSTSSGTGGAARRP